MRKTAGNLALQGYDSIFNAEQNGEVVVNLPLTDLYPPDFHPFLVVDDDSMSRLTNSIKQYGVREPGLARPRANGGYELIAGNRRKRACELAGILTLPVIVRDMDDDDAAIAMVDSNLEQREKLLPSEKAWAYRVKLEALNHRGSKSDTPGQLSVDVLVEQTGESKNTIFRLIRLTELVPDLLDKVDAKQLSFSPAVELSYLTRTEQADVADIMARRVMKPSLSQAQRLKKASKDGGLTLHIMESILSSLKKPPSDQPYPTRFCDYFPPGTPSKQMEKVIIELLKDWKTLNSAT